MTAVNSGTYTAHDCDQLIEIFESAADAIISVDGQFRVTHFNPAAQSLFGYAAPEVVGQSINMLLPEAARPGHTDRMRGFAGSGDRARMMGERRSVQGRRKDGRTVPLDISILRHDREGKRRFTAIARDISEQIQNREMLVESERKFRAIFHGSYQFTALLDTRGNLLDINRTARNFVEDEARCNQGAPFWKASWWADETARARVRDAVARGIRGCFDRTVVTVRGSRGQVTHVDLSVKPILSDSREISFLVAEGRDITELMDANAALRKSESRLAHAQRIASLGNWEWDLETNRLHWSDEVYRIFGLTPQTFAPTFDAFLDCVHPDDQEPLNVAVRKALDHGVPYSFVHRVITAGGKEKVVHERGEVLRNDAGTPISMTGTIQDITETWQRQHELAEARDRAETASRSKSQFLATMSHELRTPLNAIIGFSELIESQVVGPVADEYCEYARYVRDSGRHLLQIINDILDVSRVELGSIVPQYDYFSPDALLDTVSRMVSRRAEEKNLLLMSTGFDGATELFLDERLCRQILLNLVTNAIKFCPSGGKIEMGVFRSDEDVGFFVNDDGPGILEDQIGRVFEPFFQAEGEYARTHDGVGLGLTIVKKFAEVQAGRVHLDSRAGKGTRVTVLFPESVMTQSALAHTGSCG